MNWICLVCEKPVEVDPGATGSMKPACWPCVGGGTVEMHFGYFSRFDDMNGIAGRCVTHQAVICDDCYEKKQHLTRPVVARDTTEWEELPLDYRESRGQGIDKRDEGESREECPDKRKKYDEDDYASSD